MQTYTCQCGAPYQSDDEYFCESCVATRKRVAAEVDAKAKARESSRVSMSSIARYDSLPKVRGFVRASDIL